MHAVPFALRRIQRTFEERTKYRWVNVLPLLFGDAAQPLDLLLFQGQGLRVLEQTAVEALERLGAEGPPEPIAAQRRPMPAWNSPGSSSQNLRLDRMVSFGNRPTLSAKSVNTTRIRKRATRLASGSASISFALSPPRPAAISLVTAALTALGSRLYGSVQMALR
jgi:hypothetical protein